MRGHFIVSRDGSGSIAISFLPKTAEGTQPFHFSPRRPGGTAISHLPYGKVRIAISIVPRAGDAQPIHFPLRQQGLGGHFISPQDSRGYIAIFLFPEGRGSTLGDLRVREVPPHLFFHQKF